MSTINLVQGKFESFLDNGTPNNGGTVGVYIADGTYSTLKTHYNSSSLLTPNANPLTLDSAGRATIYYTGDSDIRVRDSSGNIIYSQRNVSPQSVVSVVNITSTTTINSSHYAQFIQVSGSGVTLNLTDAGTLGAGWYTDIINTDSTNSVTIGRLTGSDTINDVTGNVTLLPKQSIRIVVNYTNNGFIITVSRSHSSRYDLSDGSLSGGLIFEGSTADSSELTLTVVDPTADRTITLPDATGTVSLSDPIISSRNLLVKNNATNPNYQLDISADYIVVENSSNVALKLATWSLTVDITASGANGLDTGSEASNTWYFVWAIYDGTNKRGLLSTSSTAPTMPGGYTYKALLGAWRNDGSSNFKVGRQVDNEFFYLSQELVVNGGGPAVETSIDVSAYVPTIAKTYTFNGYSNYNCTTAGNFNGSVNLRVTSGVVYRYFTVHSGYQNGTVTSAVNANDTIVPNVSQTCYYISVVGANLNSITNFIYLHSFKV